MNCAQVDELIGAYALDALDAEDARAVREHVVGCAAHAREARELRASAGRLAATAEPRTPPDALRLRILDAVREADASRQPADLSRERARRRPPISWYLGAAAAAIIVGLVAWNVVLLNRGGGDDIQSLASAARVATLQAQGGGAAGSGVVLYLPEERRAIVIGDGMQELTASQTYQLWAIDGGKPRSIGLMRADGEGHAVAVVPFEGGQGQTLAITVEPAGGSPLPTSDPIFATKI